MLRSAKNKNRQGSFRAFPSRQVFKIYVESVEAIEVRDKIRAAEKLLVERKRFGLWGLLCAAGALAASALISIRDAWLSLPGNDGLYNFGAHVAVSPLLR